MDHSHKCRLLLGGQMACAGQAWSCTPPHANVTQVAIPRRPCRLLLPMPTHLALRTRRQATARAGRVGAQHEQRSEETGAGQIANEKWLTTRQSGTMRERQLLYLQHMLYCSSLQKTTVCGNFLRHCVSRVFDSVSYWKQIA
jgi:hypothetical protein